MLDWLKKNAVPEVSVSELKAARDAGEAEALIDVRSPAEFAEGHAPGAVNIPLGEVGNRRSELAQYDGKKVFLICRSGARSTTAAKTLIPMGVDAVNVAGGTMAWIRAGYDVEQ